MNEVTAVPDPPTDAQRLALLSDREVSACQLVVDGMSNSDIAYRLDIQAQTVKVHLRNAFKKLGIKHRIELIRFIKPRRIPVSKKTDFEPGDEMILDLISAGLTNQQVSEVINEKASPDKKVAVNDVRVVVGRLRRWTGIDTQTSLAIWWLHHRGYLDASDEQKNEEASA